MSVQVGKAGFITKEQEIYQGGNKVNEIYAGDQMVYPATYVKKRTVEYKYDIWQLPKKRIYNHGEILKLDPPRGIENGIRINKYFENGKVVRDTDEVKAVFFADKVTGYHIFFPHEERGVYGSTVYFYLDWLELYEQGERDSFIEPVPLFCFGKNRKDPHPDAPRIIYSKYSDRAVFLVGYSWWNPDGERNPESSLRNDLVSPFLVTTYDFDISYIPKKIEKPTLKRKNFVNYGEYLHAVQEKYKFDILGKNNNKFTIRVIPNEGMYVWSKRKIPDINDIILAATEEKMYYNETPLGTIAKNKWEETYISGFYESGLINYWYGEKPVMLVNPDALSREISYFVFDKVPVFYQLIGNYKTPFIARPSYEKMGPSDIAFLDKEFQYYPARGKIFTYKYNTDLDSWVCTTNGVNFDGIEAYGEDCSQDFNDLYPEIYNHKIGWNDTQIFPQNHVLFQIYRPDIYYDNQSVYGPVFLGYKTYLHEVYYKYGSNTKYYRGAWKSVWNVDPGDAESYNDEDETIRWQVINDGI